MFLGVDYLPKIDHFNSVAEGNYLSFNANESQLNSIFYLLIKKTTNDSNS